MYNVVRLSVYLSARNIPTQLQFVWPVDRGPTSKRELWMRIREDSRKHVGRVGGNGIGRVWGAYVRSVSEFTTQGNGPEGLEARLHDVTARILEIVAESTYCAQSLHELRQNEQETICMLRQIEGWFQEFHKQNTLCFRFQLWCVLMWKGFTRQPDIQQLKLSGYNHKN